jgi:hypothetical protein
MKSKFQFDIDPKYNKTIIALVLLIIGIVVYIAIYKIYNRHDIVPSVAVCIVMYFVLSKYKLQELGHTMIMKMGSINTGVENELSNCIQNNVDAVASIVNTSTQTLTDM